MSDSVPPLSAMDETHSISPEKIVESNLEIHKYCVEYLNEEKIYILVIINSTNQAWVWVGSQEAPTFKYLSIAMQSKLSPTPICTSVIGHSSMGLPSISSSIAERLTMKFKRVFIVSYNLKEDQDGQLQLFAEKNVFDIFKKLLN
ncbi:hypothetical protein C9374_006123 [Naegleria lovaniensis]|uniref:Proteasome assembly chaperone 4 n=1 Tax=Naegleria lovaniensis TaxID=51637 RepID=A0AA88KHF9_NAELO|nr:uncharacterized protein C9374_006123 [Naegleria lovaniensis]KAG2381739.1 hypothetical protein C9374_006123 [Naegleria lovaniensis]